MTANIYQLSIVLSLNIVIFLSCIIGIKKFEFYCILTIFHLIPRQNPIFRPFVASFAFVLQRCEQRRHRAKPIPLVGRGFTPAALLA